jgi:hypothetical protein
MIVIGEEKYLLATEAAKHLKISRTKFYVSYKSLLEQVPVGQMERLYYRASDLNRLLVERKAVEVG